MRREHFTGTGLPDSFNLSGTTGRFLAADADLGLVEDARKCKVRLDAFLDQFWSYDHGEVL